MRTRTLVFLIETVLPEEEFDTPIAPYTSKTLSRLAYGLKRGTIGRKITETTRYKWPNGIMTRTTFIHGDENG